jgi:hypothetical protein
LFDNAVDFKLLPTTHCIGVELFWEDNDFVAIRFIYQSNNSSDQKAYHGSHINRGHRGSPIHNETFMMHDGERINKVTWYVGTYVWSISTVKIRYVLGIQFYTTARRMSQLYGSNKGEMYTESPEGFTLGYARGRAGFLVDMLQFVWYNQGK